MTQQERRDLAAEERAHRFKRYKFGDWMAKYRPDGLGYIGMTSFDSKNGMVEQSFDTFTEVICDLCNAEILPPKDVISSDSYAYCEDCGKEHLPGGKYFEKT